MKYYLLLSVFRIRELNPCRYLFIICLKHVFSEIHYVEVIQVQYSTIPWLYNIEIQLFISLIDCRPIFLAVNKSLLFVYNPKKLSIKKPFFALLLINIGKESINCMTYEGKIGVVSILFMFLAN